MIGHRALGRIQELAAKLDMKVKPDLIQKVSVCLAEFTRMADLIDQHREPFVSAFWAGYGLYGLTHKTDAQVSEDVDDGLIASSDDEAAFN
jgi:hypothetical protein